jgi:hypothetical protein
MKKPNNKENRWKRGDAHPFSGLYFWAYIPRCKNGERWISYDKYIELDQLSKQRDHKSEYQKYKHLHTQRKQDPNYKELENARRRNKTLSDPLYAMKCRMRSRMHKLLKSKNMSKTTKTIKAIGCDWSELVNHIERQFRKGMSWSNRDKWHIDHIVPLSSAKTEYELIERCNYMNLRPAWAYENMSKGAKNEYLLLTA